MCEDTAVKGGHSACPKEFKSDHKWTRSKNCFLGESTMGWTHMHKRFNLISRLIETWRKRTKGWVILAKQ